MSRAIFDFLQIGSREKERARELWRLISPQMDALLSRFYCDLAQTPAGDLLAPVDVDRLVVRQKEHWALLFAANFDDDYSRSVRRIGIRHHDIGLGPDWYIASYTALKLQFIEVIIEADLNSTEKVLLIKTLEKCIAVDLGLALSAYSAVIV